jgi:hypothetical protein
MTPHKIVVLNPTTNQATTYPKSGTVARAHVERQLDDKTIDGNSITNIVVTKVNIPQPTEGIYYIVSMQTKNQLPNRPDLLVPDSINATRGIDGKVTSVPGFIR